MNNEFLGVNLDKMLDFIVIPNMNFIFLKGKYKLQVHSLEIFATKKDTKEVIHTTYMINCPKVLLV